MDADVYISCLSEHIVCSLEGEIPKGAVYLSQKETVDGDVKTTDTYYTMPIEEKSSETNVVEKKPVIHEGIGPVDAKGMPLAFRMVINFLKIRVLK